MAVRVTDADGRACFDELTVGTAYIVTETAAPAGTSIDTTSKSVTPTSPDSCTSGTPDGVCFIDSPLTGVLVKATSEVPGATNSTITCVDYRSSNIGNTPQGPTDSAQVTKPGTYACTIVVDP